MIVWGRAEDIQSDVAHVPENWLRTFSVRHPGDIRKFGNSRNSTLLFRSSAILAAVEAGETSEAEKQDEAKRQEGAGETPKEFSKPTGTGGVK